MLKLEKNDNNEFLEGANKAYEMIVQAYQSNSIEKVKDLLTPEAMQAMEQAKAPKEIKFSEVKNSSILDDKSDDLRLVKSVKFETESYGIKVHGGVVLDDNNGYIDDIHGWNFAANIKNGMDDEGHGTHCAGIIGAQGNNVKGISGVMWDTKLMSLKLLILCIKTYY